MPARSPQAAILSHEDNIGRKIASFPFQAATSTTAGFCLGQTVTAVETGQKAIPQGCVLLLYYIVIIYVFSAIYVTLFQSRCQVLFEPSRQKTCRTTIHLGQVKKKRAETGRYFTNLHFQSSKRTGKHRPIFLRPGQKMAERQEVAKKIAGRVDKFAGFGIMNLAVSINCAELCKGSTTDSDSVCEGSNPSSAAKGPCRGSFLSRCGSAW